jgi:hypothetical protein
MGRSNGASFEIVTGNLVEEFNGVPFEFFNGVNSKQSLPYTVLDYKNNKICIFYQANTPSFTKNYQDNNKK